MKSELKNTLFSIFVLLMIFLTADRIVGWIGYKLIDKVPESNYWFSKMKHSLYYAESDCIILGSSRANCHYNSKLLSDLLKIDIYNTGRDGHSSVYAAGVFKALTSRYNPKMVVLEVDYNELSGGGKERINTLKPFYKDFPQIYDLALHAMGNLERIRCFFCSYRFNSTLLPMVNTFFAEKDTLKGFTPILYNESQYPLEIRISNNEKRSIIPITHSVIIEICNYCLNNEIFLVICVSPSLIQYDYESEIEKVIADLGIPFLNYSNNEFYFNNTELFRDHTHLNSRGADIFSKQFAIDVSKLDGWKKVIEN